MLVSANDAVFKLDVVGQARPDKARIRGTGLSLLDHLVIEVTDGYVRAGDLDAALIVVVLVGGVVCPADKVAAVDVNGLVVDRDSGALGDLIVVPGQRGRRVDVSVCINEKDLTLCITCINVKTVTDVSALCVVNYVKKRGEADLYTNVCVADLQGLNPLDGHGLLVRLNPKKRSRAGGHIVRDLGVVKDKCASDPKGVGLDNDGLLAVVTESVGSAGLSFNGQLVFICIVVRSLYSCEVIGNTVANCAKIGILYYNLHSFSSPESIFI